MALLKALFWRAFLRSGCCILVVVRVLLLRVFHHSDVVFVLIFSLFYFFSWLCASLMSFDILLVQRLGVIGIFAILIYSLYIIFFHAEGMNLVRVTSHHNSTNALGIHNGSLLLSEDNKSSILLWPVLQRSSDLQIMVSSPRRTSKHASLVLKFS